MALKYNILCGLLLICLAGCGEATYKVTGTVKFDDGSPVTLGFVSFDSDKLSFTAPIDAQGHYASPGVKGKGIPSGIYRVSLSGTTKVTNVPDARGQLTQGPTEETVAKKFRSPETSGLTFEAKSGGPKTFDVTVEKPGK